MMFFISDQHCLLSDPAPPGSSGLPDVSKLCHLHHYTVKHSQAERDRERKIYISFLSSFLYWIIWHIEDLFYLKLLLEKNIFIFYV